MGSKLGVDKIAAKRVGLSYLEYMAKIEQGFKWCAYCHCWKLRSEFGNDTSRGDGLDAHCFTCRHVKTHKVHQLRAPTIKSQTDASNAVRYAIVKGKLASPTQLPCFQCTHPAEVYHHHLGYAREHWFDVRALCRSCHSFIHWNGDK